MCTTCIEHSWWPFTCDAGGFTSYLVFCSILPVLTDSILRFMAYPPSILMRDWYIHCAQLATVPKILDRPCSLFYPLLKENWITLWYYMISKIAPPMIMTFNLSGLIFLWPYFENTRLSNGILMSGDLISISCLLGVHIYSIFDQICVYFDHLGIDYSSRLRKK